MAEPKQEYDDFFFWHGFGSAHSVGSDGPERDRVEELRKTVEEVTRKPVQRPVRKIGFY